MKTKLSVLALSTLAMLASCNQPKGDEASSTEVDSSAVEAEVTPALTKVWETDTILTTNESVLYDEGNDLLYVSNISGTPTEKDGVGFISKLNPDGSVIELKWATDGLNAPKGMTLLDNKLYVTDIDALVEIDLTDSSSINRYPVEGASFLNDVTHYDNKVYFSDMGTGKIHVFEDGNISTLADSVESINGLTFSTNGDIYGLDATGLRKYSMEGAAPEVINDVVTGGDGLIFINDTTFIASRWQGEIYLIKGGKEYPLLDTKEEKLNTADIGYIPEKKLVLVPTFFGNKVTAYELSY